MEQPWYTWAPTLVHVEVAEKCSQCEASVRRWARAMGIDPDLIVWESRGLKETPIRVVVDRCDRLRVRGG